MQLVAYGAQDIYLTGNPQITFFKVVYRRHTNFSMEAIEQTFNGNKAFGNRVTATISRNGDLVSRLYLAFNPREVLGEPVADAGQQTVSGYIGNSLIDEVEVEIGGQRIDRQYGKWMTVWSDLTQPNPSKSVGSVSGDGRYNVVSTTQGYGPPTPYQRMSFNIHGYNANGQGAGANKRVDVNHATVPLEFWFCRNPGLALPLIALQYHEVKINLSFVSKFGALTTLPTAAKQFTTNPKLDSVKLWADYIYLDTDERRRFAQVSHEYLIEQLQYQNFTSNQVAMTLNFNHPVKELIWTGAPKAVSDTSAHATSGPTTPQRMRTTVVGAAAAASELDRAASADVVWTLKLNGHERFAPRHTNYFTQTQVFQHHTGCGGVLKDNSLCVYSFALKPEEHQPSGTCNFSRIDSAQLVPSKGVYSSGGENLGIDVYAVNYNVLRIMSGMGGLAYSN